MYSHQTAQGYIYLSLCLNVNSHIHIYLPPTWQQYYHVHISKPRFPYLRLNTGLPGMKLISPASGNM